MALLIAMVLLGAAWFYSAVRRATSDRSDINLFSSPPKKEVANCDPDCAERIACARAGEAGHHYCGVKPCGCAKHHFCECSARLAKKAVPKQRATDTQERATWGHQTPSGMLLFAPLATSWPEVAHLAIVAAVVIALFWFMSRERGGE